MPRINAGDRLPLGLDAGKVLTVTCDAQSSAIVRSYPSNTQGAESNGQTAVGAGQTVNFGPYLVGARFQLEGGSGTVSYAIGDDVPDYPSEKPVVAFDAGVSSGGVMLPVFAKKRRFSALHAGDSIAGFGDAYQDITRSTSDTAIFGNGAFSITAMSWANGTASSGTLTFNKAAQTLSWTAPGETAGPAVSVARAGIYTLPGATASKTLTIVCRPRAYSGSTEGTYTVTPTAGTEISRRSGKAAANWIHAKCAAGFDLTIQSNGGSRIADITESLSWQVTPGQFDKINVNDGTNDVAQGRTLAQMIADKTDQIALLRRLAPNIELNTITPRSSGMDAALRRILHGYNTWLTGLRITGVRVCNTYAVIVDPDSATGDPASTTTEDGLHLAIRGSEMIGEQGYLDTIDLFSVDSTTGMSAQDDTYDATSNPYGNQLVNGGTFTGSGGNVAGSGMSGTLGSGWIVERESGANITVVCSKVARPDGRPGFLQRLVVANTGGSAQTIILRQLSASQVTVAAGQKWKGQGAFTATGLAACESIAVAIIPDSPGSGRMESQFGSGTVAGSFLTGDKRKVVMEPYEHEVPSGATKLQLALRVRLAATSGAATIDLPPGEWKLWRTL